MIGWALAPWVMMVRPPCAPQPAMPSVIVAAARMSNDRAMCFSMVFLPGRVLLLLELPVYLRRRLIEVVGLVLPECLDLPVGGLAETHRVAFRELHRRCRVRT